jgi:hypothetical protein
MRRGTDKSGERAYLRLHVDHVPPSPDDKQTEVERLIGLGATRVDVGQDGAEAPWVVLADPDGDWF